MGDNTEPIGLGDFQNDIMKVYLKEVKKELIEKDKQIEKNIWDEFKEDYNILFAKLKYLLLTLHEEDKKLIDMMINLDIAASKLKGEEEPKKGKKDTKEEEPKKSNADLTNDFLQKIKELGEKLKGVVMDEKEPLQEQTTFMQEIDNELTKLEKQRKAIEVKMELKKSLKIGSSIKIKKTVEDAGEDAGEDAVLFFDNGSSYIVKKGETLEEVVIGGENTITIDKDNAKTIDEKDLEIIKVWVKSVIEKEKEEEEKIFLDSEIIKEVKNFLGKNVEIKNHKDAMNKLNVEITRNDNEETEGREKRGGEMHKTLDKLRKWKPEMEENLLQSKQITPPPPKNDEGEDQGEDQGEEGGESLALNPKVKKEQNEASKTKKKSMKPHPPGRNPDPLLAKEEIKDAIKQRDEKIEDVNKGREEKMKLKPINFNKFLTKISDNDIPKLSEEIRKEMNKIDQNKLGGISDSAIEGYNNTIGKINTIAEKLGGDNVNAGKVLTEVSELLNSYSPEPSKTGEEPKDESKDDLENVLDNKKKKDE